MSDIVAQLQFARSGGLVTRFHTHPRIATETDAQHTYGALCILFIITDGKAELATVWALLFHDSGEHKVGDVPAPTKKKLGPEFAAMWNAAEAAEVEAVGLPSEGSVGMREYRLIKMCDILDGVFSCIEEVERGNRLSALVPLRNFYRYASDYIVRMHNESNAGWVLKAADLMTYAEQRITLAGVSHIVHEEGDYGRK